MENLLIFIPSCGHRQTLEFDYTNVNGKHARRRVLPDRIYPGRTEYYPVTSWLFRAFDLEKREWRTFNLAKAQNMDAGAPATDAELAARDSAK